MITLRVLDIGRTETSYRAVYEPPTMYTRIELAVAGSARFTAGEPLVLKKGMIGIFPPGTFRIEFPDRTYRSVFIHTMMLPPLHRPIALPINRYSTAGKIFTLLTSMPSGTDRSVIARLAESLLTEVNRTEKIFPGADTRMAAVMRHIIDSEGRTSVAMLAGITALHPKYFMKAFKREFGMTAEACIDTERLATARRSLSESRSVPETAERAGFSNEKSFGRFFKRRTGITPGEFRSMHKVPSICVPRIRASDLAHAPWDEGTLLDRWFTIYEATPYEKKITGRIMHDTSHLYVRIEERCDTSRLIADTTIHNGDDWEIMFGPRRDHPYRYIKASPDGRIERLIRDGTGNRPWRRNVPVIIERKRHAWSIAARIPLSDIAFEKNGRTVVYGNLFRQRYHGTHIALASTLSFSFHTPSRFAYFELA
ncbi:MAG: helix-turn-helix domain-containing protein [Spirochaetota bacterium]